MKMFFVEKKYQNFNFPFTRGVDKTQTRRIRFQVENWQVGLVVC